MKIKISKLYKSNKDKQGNPLKTKDGRPYTRIAIQTPAYGSKWISGFMGSWNFDWQAGDEVDIDIEESGQYLNFKRPDPIKKLEERIVKLEEAVFPKLERDPNENEDECGELSTKDIPF